LSQLVVRLLHVSRHKISIKEELVDNEKTISKDYSVYIDKKKETKGKLKKKNPERVPW